MSIKAAIFGGTFNPFHIGHYEMLKALCNDPLFDIVYVMPDKIPPHKICDFLASDEDRINMCRLACEDFAKSHLLLTEFERKEKSYTSDTVEILKSEFPNTEFYITVGSDMLETLDTWHDYKKLFSNASFVAFRRGNDYERFNKNVLKMRAKGAIIKVMNEEITEISSSQLRNSLSPEFIPEKIYDYIKKKGIYNEASK